MVTTSTDAASGSESTNDDELVSEASPQRESTLDGYRGDKKRKAAAISSTPLHENETKKCRARSSTDGLSKATAPTNLNATRTDVGDDADRQAGKEAAITNLTSASEEQQQQLQQYQASQKPSILFYAVKTCTGILEEPVIFFGFNDLKRYILPDRLRTSSANLEYQQFNDLASALEYLHTTPATTAMHDNANITHNSNGNYDNKVRDERPSQPGGAIVRGQNRANHQGQSTPHNTVQKEPRNSTRGKTLSLPMRTKTSSRITTPEIMTTAATKTPATLTDHPTQRQEQQQQQQQQQQRLPGTPHGMAQQEELAQKARQTRTRRTSGTSRFDKKLAELKAFKEEYGHLEPPTKTHGNLRIWLGNKRRSFYALQEGKESKITLEQIVALTELGVSFTSTKQERRKPLKDIVAEYIDFVKKHGRFPKRSKDQEENRLFNASNTWRQRRKLYTEHGIEKWDKLGSCILPQELINALDSVNFKWDIKLKWSRRGKKTVAVPFEVNLERLKAYKAKHGHCEPPFRHPKLGRFVLRQRQEYKAMIEGKRSNMTMEKFRLLSEIDFRFKLAGPGHPRKRYVDDDSSGYDSSDDDEGENGNGEQQPATKKNNHAQFEDPISD